MVHPRQGTNIKSSAKSVRGVEVTVEREEGSRFLNVQLPQQENEKNLYERRNLLNIETGAERPFLR